MTELAFPAVTRLGQHLRAGVPRSLREVALIQGAPGHWLPWGLLPEAIRAGQTQAERALGIGIMDYFIQNPEEAAGFTRAMSDRTAASVALTPRGSRLTPRFEVGPQPGNGRRPR